VEFKTGGKQLPHRVERFRLPADVSTHHLPHSMGGAGAWKLGGCCRQQASTCSHDIK
jgi:hypothetical protein